MSGFNNNSGTTQSSFEIGGPAGPALQSDPLVQAINLLDPTGTILLALRAGWAVNPNDVVTLVRLQSILNPPPPLGDPWASSSAG
jgi:hypothetical protein